MIDVGRRGAARIVRADLRCRNVYPRALVIGSEPHLNWRRANNGGTYHHGRDPGAVRRRRGAQCLVGAGCVRRDLQRCVAVGVHVKRRGRRCNRRLRPPRRAERIHRHPRCEFRSAPADLTTNGAIGVPAPSRLVHAARRRGVAKQADQHAARERHCWVHHGVTRRVRRPVRALVVPRAPVVGGPLRIEAQHGVRVVGDLDVDRPVRMDRDRAAVGVDRRLAVGSDRHRRRRQQRPNRVRQRSELGA